MASKDQFEAFKYLFSWEEERAKSLAESGKNYLTIISLFFAYLGYKITDPALQAFLSKSWRAVPYGMVLYAILMVFFLVSMLATLYSMFMHGYEDVTDAEDIFTRSVEEKMSDDQFYDVLITHMVVATERNSAVNDRRARRLETASVALFGGFVVYGVVFFLAVAT
jgi:hypothetical protein